jgi:ribosomal protein S1
MSRLDPSRFADQSVDVASSDDQAEVSLDDAKRSAMVGQTIKAKIIQACTPCRQMQIRGSDLRGKPPSCSMPMENAIRNLRTRATRNTAAGCCSIRKPRQTVFLGVQVNVPERLLVLSERAAYMADLSKTLKRGDVVEGTVQKLTDYGAFVSITAADGNQHGTDVRLVRQICMTC